MNTSLTKSLTVTVVPFQNYKRNNIYYVDLYVFYHPVFITLFYGFNIQRHSVGEDFKNLFKKWGEMWKL